MYHYTLLNISSPSNFLSMGRGCSSKRTLHSLPPLPGFSPYTVKKVRCVPAAAFSSDLRAIMTVSWDPGRNFTLE